MNYPKEQVLSVVTNRFGVNSELNTLSMLMTVMEEQKEHLTYGEFSRVVEWFYAKYSPECEE